MRIMIILLAATLIYGCATSYQSDGFSGGHSETQLDEQVFKVTFRGNGYTRRERAADLSLLRCAELALQNGYNYFVIIDADSYVSNSTYTTPTTTNTTASAYGTGNYAYGTAQSTTYGGQTYNISKPSSTNVIYLLKENPTDVFAYSAKFVYKSISEKYGIKNQSE
ncbi:MAG: hypothetical protein GY938_11585 [Ketobacter sp.]|nr:hypothetical protein [Ketobacter sp.]